MLRLIPLAALLAFSPRSAAAQDAAPPCQPLMSVGCYLERPGATAVLIYHRGFLTQALPGERRARGGGAIPPELLAKSAEQAVRQYDLATAAAALNASLVVTGAYYVGVNAAAYARGRKVFIAAHSGGIEGLAKTLDGAPRLDGVALLDCFYGEDSGSLAAVGERMAALLAASPAAACGGFYTPHNASRLRRIFYPALADQGDRCRFDTRAKDEHESAVAEELVRALHPSALLKSLQSSPTGGLVETGGKLLKDSGPFSARWEAETQGLERSIGIGGR